MRKARSPQSISDEEVLHFSLQGLLLPEQVLAFNTISGTLSLLSIENSEPRLMVEQQFTTSEICVLLPILEAYPYFCAYEVLLASFAGGRVTDEAIKHFRQRLQEAQEEGVWDQEMRPIRNVLSRARLKCQDIGLDISSLIERGYLLCTHQRRTAPA